MKRVFQVSEITTLCNELKTLLNGCKTHISNMKTYAEQADEALAEVPGEVRHYGAVYSVSELRSALKTEKIEDALTKLENCRVRACELIPAADTDYAAQTRELMGGHEKPADTFGGNGAVFDPYSAYNRLFRLQKSL
ncbi:hypothetical protein [Blautia argi]|uniref:Uncharacterized protein n=1 Tax=Blautia argi TaxID=1912897 RepID=A0A2Z4UAE3_9FIRM|nr:hypothetical protein [Blautia argi]AWY98015.1 hypothetical protein DQQ01_07530 [Blautia argi]